MSEESIHSSSAEGKRLLSSKQEAHNSSMLTVYQSFATLSKIIKNKDEVTVLQVKKKMLKIWYYL